MWFVPFISSAIVALCPIPVFINWGTRWVTQRTTYNLFEITLICITLTLCCTFSSFFIDMLNVPKGLKCITGVGAFAIIGFILNLVVIPAGIVLFIIARYLMRKRSEI